MWCVESEGVVDEEDDSGVVDEDIDDENDSGIVDEEISVLFSPQSSVSKDSFSLF